MKNFSFVKTYDSWDQDPLENIVQDFIFDYQSLNLKSMETSSRYYYLGRDSKEIAEKIHSTFGFELVFDLNHLTIKYINPDDDIETKAKKIKNEFCEIEYIFEYGHLISRVNMILLLILFLPRNAKPYLYKKLKDADLFIKNELEDDSEDLDKLIFDGLFATKFKKNYEKLIDDCLSSDPMNRITLFYHAGEIE